MVKNFLKKVIAPFVLFWQEGNWPARFFLAWFLTSAIFLLPWIISVEYARIGIAITFYGFPLALFAFFHIDYKRTH